MVFLSFCHGFPWFPTFGKVRELLVGLVFFFGVCFLLALRVVNYCWNTVDQLMCFDIIISVFYVLVWSFAEPRIVVMFLKCVWFLWLQTCRVLGNFCCIAVSILCQVVLQWCYSKVLGVSFGCFPSLPGVLTSFACECFFCGICLFQRVDLC